MLFVVVIKDQPKLLVSTIDHPNIIEVYIYLQNWH